MSALFYQIFIFLDFHFFSIAFVANRVQRPHFFWQTLKFLDFRLFFSSQLAISGLTRSQVLREKQVPTNTSVHSDYLEPQRHDSDDIYVLLHEERDMYPPGIF